MHPRKSRMGDNMRENHKQNDSDFTKLFSEPQKLLALYNMLSGSQYPLDSSLKIMELPNSYFADRQNDICFEIDNIIVVISLQSTISENLALRLFMILARFYDTYLYDSNIYARNLINIPRPEIIVLYTGNDDFPKERTLKLSDSFKGGGGDIELEVKVLDSKGLREEIVI